MDKLRLFIALQLARLANWIKPPFTVKEIIKMEEPNLSKLFGMKLVINENLEKDTMLMMGESLYGSKLDQDNLQATALIKNIIP